MLLNWVLHVIHALGYFVNDQSARVEALGGVNLGAASAVIELRKLMDSSVGRFPDNVLAGGSAIREHHPNERILWNIRRQVRQRRLLLLRHKTSNETSEDERKRCDSLHKRDLLKPTTGFICRISSAKQGADVPSAPALAIAGTRDFRAESNSV